MSCLQDCTDYSRTDTKCNSMVCGSIGAADQRHAAGQWHCACDTLPHRDEPGQAGVPAALGQMLGHCHQPCHACCTNVHAAHVNICIWPSHHQSVRFWVQCTLMVAQYEERERCGRTVYVANVDERLEAADVRRFFSKFCGERVPCSLHDTSHCCCCARSWMRGLEVYYCVCRLAGRISAMRLLRSTKAPTQIAFVEFAVAESASAALDWSGSLLGWHCMQTLRVLMPRSDLLNYRFPSVALLRMT